MQQGWGCECCFPPWGCGGSDGNSANLEEEEKVNPEGNRAAKQSTPLPSGILILPLPRSQPGHACCCRRCPGSDLRLPTAALGRRTPRGPRAGSYSLLLLLSPGETASRAHPPTLLNHRWGEPQPCGYRSLLVAPGT